MAISELEQKGIARESIYAFPLKLRVKERKIFDSINRADGISLFDGMAACGTLFMIIGAIFGYLWTWGPIIWGLIGLAFGSTLGFVLDCFVSKALRHKNNHRTMVNNKKGDRISEVILIIDCAQEDVTKIEDILWENAAIAVS